MSCNQAMKMDSQKQLSLYSIHVGNRCHFSHGIIDDTFANVCSLLAVRPLANHQCTFDRKLQIFPQAFGCILHLCRIILHATPFKDRAFPSTGSLTITTAYPHSSRTAPTDTIIELITTPMVQIHRVCRKRTTHPMP